MIIAETSDGSFIVGGYFYSSTITLDNGETLTNKGSPDGILIKYNSRGEIEWGKAVGGTDDDNIRAVIETSDGGLIVGGYSRSTITLDNGETLTNKGSYYGMIIKFYPKELPSVEIKQGKVVGGTKEDRIQSVTETSDGGYVAVGYFASNTITLDNGEKLTSKGGSDGMIIKYKANGEVEWGKTVGGNSNEYIQSVAETSDGGFVAVGYFVSNTITLDNGETLTNHRSSYYDGMIIKYNSNGEVEWGKAVGGTIAETSDGSFIVGGYFYSSTITLDNGETLTNKGSHGGILIKYNSRGEAEWGKAVGGTSSEYIQSVTETSDGGYIAVGYLRGTITLDNGETLTSKGSYDGMIIKYNREGKVEWGKTVGETGNEFIYSVVETSDGGFVIGGDFSSTRITLDNGETLTNKGNDDGIIIKYDQSGDIEWRRNK